MNGNCKDDSRALGMYKLYRSNLPQCAFSSRNHLTRLIIYTRQKLQVHIMKSKGKVIILEDAIHPSVAAKPEKDTHRLKTQQGIRQTAHRMKNNDIVADLYFTDQGLSCPLYVDSNLLLL